MTFVSVGCPQNAKWNQNCWEHSRIHWRCQNKVAVTFILLFGSTTFSRFVMDSAIRCSYCLFWGFLHKNDSFIWHSCPVFFSRKRKLSGFGHRVYKNYDPRAKVLKKLTEEVFSIVGRDPLIEVFIHFIG